VLDALEPWIDHEMNIKDTKSNLILFAASEILFGAIELVRGWGLWYMMFYILGYQRCCK